MNNIYDLFLKLLKRITPIRCGGTGAKNALDAVNNLGFGGKILWQSSGGWWMKADQSAALNAPISEQPNGIVLCFCYYSTKQGKAMDYDWHCCYVPKKIVEEQPGKGHTFNMASSGYGRVSAKYLYIGDETITGYSGNTVIESGSGISINNQYQVLRYVIGV